MKLIVFYLFALAWSLGQSRGIGVGSDPNTDSLNDDIKQDAEFEEQNDAEASVEVEEAEEEVLEATPEEEIEKAKRLIPILMRLQKKYPTLGKDEQVKVLRQSSGYKEDFKEALDKLEASPEISHDLDIPYLRQILGVVRPRKRKKETIPTPEGSPVETNIIPKEDENKYPIESGLTDEDEDSELSEEDLTRDIVVEGLFAVDFDPDSKIAKEGIFAVDVIDPDSEIVTVGLFAGNATGTDDEDLEGFPFARAASFIPRPHQEPLPRIPPTAPQPQLPQIPSEFANIPLDDFEDFADYFDDFNEVEINLNFAAPFPSPKRKPSYPRRSFYPPQQRTYLPPLTRSLPYPPQVARTYPILPLQPQFPPTHIYHRPMHSRKRRSTAPSHPYVPPHHYLSHYTHHPQTPYTQYPRQQMYQMYNPYWDTSYQQAYRHQPLRYGEYNPYVFDYQTSASLDDPLLTAHFPSDYYGYSMQSLPSLRPSNPFSQMQAPGLSLNPHYQYSRAAYQNFLHESMDGQDPVKYVQGLTGV